MPRRSHHIGAMTAAAFEAAAAQHPALLPSTLAAARAVLVDGLGLSEAARQNGILHRQRVEYAASLLNPANTPAGWVRRWISLPADQMKLVTRMERDARRATKRPATVGTNHA